MYYLKLFDEDLISFDMTNNFGLEITNVKVINSNVNLYPIKFKNGITKEVIEEFIKSRVIPKNRAFVNSILESMGVSINDKKAIIDISYGLSLTDSYWIVKDNSKKFADYNLYDNNFSTVLSLVAFTGYSSKVNGIATSPEFTTNGMLPKAWRKIDGDIYLYKGSTQMSQCANTGFEPYSEYLASEVAKTMGIYSVEYGLCKWKGFLSSTCKIFTSKELSFVQIGDVVTSGGIKSVSQYLKENGFYTEFSNMILFDAICMNPDRHFGNFGFLKNNLTGKFVKFAPVFDNGESMLSKAMPNIFNNFDEFKKYIFLPEINISYYGTSYDDLVKEFCGKEHIQLLRKLLNFKFNKHPSYNLTAKRMKCLEYMISQRAMHYMELLKNKNTDVM